MGVQDPSKGAEPGGWEGAIPTPGRKAERQTSNAEPQVPELQGASPTSSVQNLPHLFPPAPNVCRIRGGA